MGKIIHTSYEDLRPRRDGDGDLYDYERRRAIPEGASRHCRVSFYRLEPGKSNYPYHYHLDREEVFYIVGGEGTLRTPDGNEPSGPGILYSFRRGRAARIS